MSFIRSGFLALIVVLPLAGGVRHAAADNSRSQSDHNPRMSPLVRAVKLCEECVVSIHTEKSSEEDKDSRFFGSKSRRVTGMGTGIVVDERGYIVTNYHVIHQVDQITVTLHNGDTYDARPVSFDRSQDLAVIHVEATRPLTVMPMGTSCDLMLAEQVFAVGNAFGYRDTVTSGIISALSRDVEVDETQSYENLIQTDASINPGNSGGPLLNMNGEVIGINVAIRAGAQRIGFAIPIDDARVTIARLLSPERLNGVIHGAVTSDVKTPTSRKLVVEQVISGSAAEKCGLKPGDVIRTARDIQVQDAADWERALLDMPAGKVIDVGVLRNDSDMTMQFTVGVGRTLPVARSLPRETPARTVAAAEPASTTAASSEPVLETVWNLFGLRLLELNERDQRSLDSRYKGGMKVVYVKSGGLAAVHGIKSGDILLGFDGYETLGTRNLSFILQEARLRKMDALSFQILRHGAGALIGRMDLNSTR